MNQASVAVVFALPSADTTKPPATRNTTLTINPLTTESRQPRNTELTDSTITPIARQTPTWLNRYRSTADPGIKFGKYFYINIPKTMVELQYEFRNIIRKSNNSETTDLYHKFTETIGFSSDGWIYHPALLTYEITFEPEFVQAYGENSSTFGNRTTSTTDSSTVFSPDYLLRLTMLESKPYTAQLFASRREIPSWSTYKGSITSNINNFGANFDLSYHNIPVLGHLYSNLNYNHLDSEVSGFNNYEFTEDIFRFRLGQRGMRLKTLVFNGTYSDRTQTSANLGTANAGGSGSFETNTERLNIMHSHLVQLLESRKSSLYGIWNYSQQKFNNPLTALEFEYLRLTEQLFWTLARNFTLYLDGTYQNTKQSGDISNDSYNSKFRLQHLLYENLTTETGIIASYNDHSTGLQQYTLNPFLTFRYIRDVPWGTLSLHTGWNYFLSERDYDLDQLQPLSALNEQHTLQYGQDTFLNNYNILIDSIIVTNSAGTVQYVRDIDYQIEQFNESVIIRPTLFGSISDGQTVSVNYSYQPDAEYSDGVFTQSYSASTTIFRSLYLSLSHNRSDQDVNQGTRPTVLSNSSTTQGKIRYDIHWSDTIFEAKQVDNDAIGSSQQWYMSQKFYYRLNNTFDLSLQGSYSETYYDNDFLDRKQYGGTLQSNWKIAHGLTFRAEGYTNTTETNEEKTVNTGLRTGLVYTYRLWNATLLYDIANREFERLGDTNSRLEHLIRLDIVRIKF